MKGKKGCDNKHIDDSVLYQAFINTYNALIENKDYFTDKWKAQAQSNDSLMRYKTSEFIKMIAEAEPIKEFDIDIYFKMIEKMIVFEGNKIIVTLLDGTEIEVLIK